MVILKSDVDVEGVREAARIASQALRVAKDLIREGVSAKDIDDAVRDFIISQGARPSFLGYEVEDKIYRYSTCVSINNEIVHGLPLHSKVLKAPMLIKVDVGVYKDGYHADTAWTFALGNVPEKARKLMMATKEALYRALDVIRPGRKISDVTFTIDRVARRYGFYPAENLTGHGVGLELHEDPVIPNNPKDLDKDGRIRRGMILAIEPMINESTERIVTLHDGWTVVTADGGWSAHYEHTIFVSADGVEILTEDVDG
ncbi:MAG: type I methionyl aminopeptidase [Thermotogae bacterium]|nr:type I methionyl aminopeptidase [Thermotogota bacterium]